MNFRWGISSSIVLAVAALGVTPLPVYPVEAGSSPSLPLLPQRFFTELPPHRTSSFAMQAATSDKKAQDSSLPDGKGKELAQKDCSTCHAVTIFTKLHHTRDEWSSVMDEMVSKGLDAPDADLTTITDYLAAHFGPKTTPPTAPDTPASSAPQ